MTLPVKSRQEAGACVIWPSSVACWYMAVGCVGPFAFAYEYAFAVESLACKLGCPGSSTLKVPRGRIGAVEAELEIGVLGKAY